MVDGDATGMTGARGATIELINLTKRYPGSRPFQAAGAKVIDRTGIQGSFGAREAVRSGDADAMYEYTGTAWITYQGNSTPVADPRRQWKAVRGAGLRNGLSRLPPSTLNNTYALALNRANAARYRTKSLSDMAEPAARDTASTPRRRRRAVCTGRSSPPTGASP